MQSRRPENGSRVNAWGYEFQWTADHLTAEELRPLIYSYDELATRCLDRFDELQSLRSRETGEAQEKGPDSPHPEKGPEKGPGIGRLDLYELLKQHASEDATLGQLWDQLNTVPDWVDWAQIGRGQDVFYRYAGPSIVGLTFSSLLGGMGSARVVETLTRTGGFNVKVARRRLLETLQHVLDATDSVPGIQPGNDGKGFASSIRVRLLHASVRRRILALADTSPEYYSVERDGVPINDLDSIGTIVAFSATLLWIAYPRQGIYLRAQEKEDCIALWRYLAHLLGTPTHPFLSARTARAWMESLLVSEIAPSDTSKALGRNMIQAIADQPPSYPSAGFLHAEARKFRSACCLSQPPSRHVRIIDHPPPSNSPGADQYTIPCLASMPFLPLFSPNHSRPPLKPSHFRVHSPQPPPISHTTNPTTPTPTHPSIHPPTHQYQN